MTEDLKRHGGHIGYGIRPAERKKGYGRQQLLLILDLAGRMGMSKVMISCDKDNIASGRTAMSCGGVLKCENFIKGSNNKFSGLLYKDEIYILKQIFALIFLLFS